MSSKGATTTPSGIEIPYTEVAMNELKKALIRIEAGASNLLERYKYSAASDIMLAVSSIRSEARGALAITDANKEPAEGDALVLAARAVVEEWAVAWERMRRGELVGAFGDVNPAVEALRAALSGEPPKEPFTKSELHVDCPNFITTRAEHRKAHKQRIQHLHQTLLHEDDPQFAGEDELVVPHEPAGEPSSGGAAESDALPWRVDACLDGVAHGRLTWIRDVNNKLVATTYNQTRSGSHPADPDRVTAAEHRAQVIVDLVNRAALSGEPRRDYIEVRTSACHAGSDGDCVWEQCPQLRDGEPIATGRHCPLAGEPSSGGAPQETNNG
jgi:hypothetical protein